MTYYHYTTKAAHDEIQRTGIFVPSNFSDALDAVYGPGWYFTDLQPHMSNRELYKLWGNVQTEKVQHFLEFEIDSTILEYCRPNVYRLPTSRLKEAHLNTKVTYSIGEKIVIALKRFGDRIVHFLRGD